MFRVLEMLGEKLPRDFFRPTLVTIAAFSVLVFGFFYFYYIYGFVDIINTFLVGDPTEYKDNFVVEGDPWGLGVAFQLSVFFTLLYFLASFVSWIFHKRAK